MRMWKVKFTAKESLEGALTFMAMNEEDAKNKVREIEEDICDLSDFHLISSHIEVSLEDAHGYSDIEFETPEYYD